MWLVDSAKELASVDLGDRRRNERAAKVAAAIQAHPDASFPELFGSSDLEAFYRLTNSEAVSADALLEPHRTGAWARAGAEGLRLVIHDTTEFSFPGEKPRKGLHRRGAASVFWAHVSLLVGLEDAPHVHGVVGFRAYVVGDHVWQESLATGGTRALDVGSDRWRDAVAATGGEAPAGGSVVHVMDREADDYPLWTAVIEQGGHFVIRSAQNRVTVGENGHLTDVLQNTSFVLRREVWLSRRTKRRPPEERKRHPQRDERFALLSIRFGPVTVRKPHYLCKNKLPKQLDLYVVEVVEEAPPEGEEPVYWRLITTLNVATALDAARVVDIYRKRWLIEEFFRCLKTGCAVEARQAESWAALLATVAFLVPVAVRLLQLRGAAREAPDASAGALLDAVEMAALRHLTPKAMISDVPSSGQVMAAIAMLGGHLKSNGEPGVTVLWRGYTRLLRFVEGWRAALSLLHAPSLPGGGPAG